jgi:hypothetical protein
MSSQSVKEIQVNCNGSLEVSYYPLSSLAAMMLANANVYLSEDIEMVSQDGDEIVVVRTTEETEDSADYYAVKYNPIKGTRNPKKYSKKFWKFPNIQLPQGSRLANQFGIGFMELNGVARYDVYFFHERQSDVERHFKRFIDCDDLVPFRDVLGLYGVTYTADYKVLNLKRYLYPFDPYCKNPDYI